MNTQVINENQQGKIIDGKGIAKQLRHETKEKVENRLAKGQRRPGLAVVIIGEDPASQVYVRNKRRACDEVGFISKGYDLPSDTTQEKLLELIDQLNQDITIDGILVQLPLPEHINETDVVERIKPDKDVDGFHPFNIGRLLQKNPQLRPCTPKAITTLLQHTSSNLKGKHAVIVGASNIVGRPLILELLLPKCTVTVCHSGTTDLEQQIARADIVVAAVGKPEFVKGHLIKEGAIVIDVGINRMANGKLIGDVEYEKAKERASAITPVPGGVGPMTIATLIDNTLYAAETLHPW